MPLTIIRKSPDVDSYTPLSTFQSETPASFSTPVLHHLQADCTVIVSSDQASLIPIFDVKTDGGGGIEDVRVEGIDLWVTNENLILFNTSLSVGAMVSYLSLTLHAIQRVHDATGLYMQISLTPDISSTSNDDVHDDDEAVELTVFPKPSGDLSQAVVANAIFKELSVCTSLHSVASVSDDGDDEDRIVFEGDGDELRFEGFPGEGGWITAENVDQFRFEDADEETTSILGPGAGSIRRRDEGDGEDDGAGDAKVVEEAKWRRTE